MEEARQGEGQDLGGAAGAQEPNVSAPSEAAPVGSEGLEAQEQPQQQGAEEAFVAAEVAPEGGAAGSTPTEQEGMVNPFAVEEEPAATEPGWVDPQGNFHGMGLEDDPVEEPAATEPTAYETLIWWDEEQQPSETEEAPATEQAEPSSTYQTLLGPWIDDEGYILEPEHVLGPEGISEQEYTDPEVAVAEPAATDGQETEQQPLGGAEEAAAAGPNLAEHLDPEWPVFENLSSRELLGVQEALSDPSSLSDPEVLNELSPHQMQAMIQAFSGYLGASGSEQTDQQAGPLDPEAPAERVGPDSDGEGVDPYGGGIPFLPDEDRDGVPDLGDPDSREQGGEWVTGESGEEVRVPFGGDEGNDILEPPEEEAGPPPPDLDEADAPPPALEDMIDPEWPVLESLSSRELLEVQEVLRDPGTLSDPEVLAEMSPQQMQAMVQAFSGYMSASGPTEATSTDSEEASGQEEGPIDPEAASTEGDGSQPMGEGALPPDSKEGVDQDDLGDAFGDAVGGAVGAAAGGGVAADLLGGDALGATEDAFDDVEGLIEDPLGSAAGGAVGGVVDEATGDIGEALGEGLGVEGLGDIAGGIAGGDAEQIARGAGDALEDLTGIEGLDDIGAGIAGGDPEQVGRGVGEALGEGLGIEGLDDIGAGIAGGDPEQIGRGVGEALGEELGIEGLDDIGAGIAGGDPEQIGRGVGEALGEELGIEGLDDIGAGIGRGDWDQAAAGAGDALGDVWNNQAAGEMAENILKGDLDEAAEHLPEAALAYGIEELTGFQGTDILFDAFEGDWDAAAQSASDALEDWTGIEGTGEALGGILEGDWDQVGDALPGVIDEGLGAIGLPGTEELFEHAFDGNWEEVTSDVGATAGAALGTALGGPIGTFVGEAVGGVVGDVVYDVGEVFVDWVDEPLADAGEFIGDAAEDVGEAFVEVFEEPVEVVEEVFEDVGGFVEDVFDIF